MKVIGISGNYGRQEENLKPTVYLMSDSSLLKDGKPFFIPDFATSFEFSPSLVLHVNRLGKNISRKFAHRYYDEVTVGLAVKACGMKDAFDGEDAGALALAFDGAAILGNFIKKESFQEGAGEFSVSIDGDTCFTGNVDMLQLDFDEIIEYVSKYFTLKIGDYIYVCTPPDFIGMRMNTVITAKCGNEEVLRFKVK